MNSAGNASQAGMRFGDMGEKVIELIATFERVLLAQ
jgi:hypothetical protein